MWFNSKKEILEYCGKDGKDTRWLDRAIKDGRVIVMEGEYCTVADYVKELEDSESDSIQTIISLRKIIDEMSASGKLTVTDTKDSDLKEHLKYAWGRLDHINECINGLVQGYFNKNRQTMGFEEAQEKFYKLINYKPDPNEKEEREFARGL